MGYLSTSHDIFDTLIAGDNSALQLIDNESAM